jgi:RimJ/RimL family protein N-acetyltransferase
VLTERLELRPAVESDRGWFVGLFCNADFMVFSGGICTRESANARFDGMLAAGAELPYAKQPVVEQSTGVIVGYCGVAPFEFEGEHRLEFGYRLVPEARGRGYATEAGRAVLTLAARSCRDELLAIIDAANQRSSNVARKLGFEFWKQGTVDDGYPVDLYRRSFT